MKKRIALVMAGMWLLGSAPATAKEASKTFTFEREQVIDFLYLTRRPDSDEAVKAYFSVAIPVAAKLGYKPLGALVVSGKPTQGNFFPNVIALGGWPGDFAARTEALEKLLTEVPDLHSRRMDIWSNFNMTNYEIGKDTSIRFDDSKYYVLTSYWLDHPDNVAGFENQFWGLVAEQSGRAVLTLTGGRSPFGYEHAPHLMTISEWDSEPNAASFVEASRALNALGVRHVNQFPIKPAS